MGPLIDIESPPELTCRVGMSHFYFFFGKQNRAKVFTGSADLNGEPSTILQCHIDKAEDPVNELHG